MAYSTPPTAMGVWLNWVLIALERKEGYIEQLRASKTGGRCQLNS